MYNQQLRVTPLQMGDYEQVEDLFAVIANDPDASHFHPHPFDATEALRLCRHTGRDLYLGAFLDQQLVGYGMLRGWDSGYEVPSLGIYLTCAVRGRGLGRPFMDALHKLARQRKAKRVMLKVYPDNRAALALYHQVGYIFAGMSSGQLVGYVDV